AGNEEWIRRCCGELGEAGVQVSLFIDPDPAQIEAAKRCGAPAIEIHTGHYADADSGDVLTRELIRVRDAVALGRDAGLIVNAGHGLHYHNTRAIAAIPG